MTYNEPSGESGAGGGMKQQDGSEEDKCLHYLTSHLPVCYPSRLSSFRCENISSWGSVCLTICMSVFSQVCLSELKVKQNSKLLVSLSPLILLDLRYIVFTFLKFCILFRRTIATDWPMHFKQLKKPVGKISNEENGSELKYARNAIILVG